MLNRLTKKWYAKQNDSLQTDSMHIPLGEMREKHALCSICTL